MVAAFIAVGVLAVALLAAYFVVLYCSTIHAHVSKKKKSKIAPFQTRRDMLGAENPDDNEEDPERKA